MYRPTRIAYTFWKLVTARNFFLNTHGHRNRRRAEGWEIQEYWPQDNVTVGLSNNFTSYNPKRSHLLSSENGAPFAPLSLGRIFRLSCNDRPPILFILLNFILFFVRLSHLIIKIENCTCIHVQYTVYTVYQTLHQWFAKLCHFGVSKMADTVMLEFRNVSLLDETGRTRERTLLGRLWRNLHGCRGRWHNQSNFDVRCFKGLQIYRRSIFAFSTDFAGHRYTSATATCKMILFSMSWRRNCYIILYVVSTSPSVSYTLSKKNWAQR